MRRPGLRPIPSRSSSRCRFATSEPGRLRLSKRAGSRSRDEPTSSADLRELVELTLDAYLERIEPLDGAARITRRELAAMVERIALDK